MCQLAVTSDMASSTYETTVALPHLPRKFIFHNAQPSLASNLAPVRLAERPVGRPTRARLAHAATSASRVGRCPSLCGARGHAPQPSSPICRPASFSTLRTWRRTAQGGHAQLAVAPPNSLRPHTHDKRLLAPLPWMSTLESAGATSRLRAGRSRRCATPRTCRRGATSSLPRPSATTPRRRGRSRGPQ